jgi:hypothetical protein
LFGWPLLAIAGSAFAVILPFFVLGITSGHDFEFQLHSSMEIESQWQQGILYPHWAALPHYEYGEARFLFYPPALGFSEPSSERSCPGRLFRECMCGLP